MSKKYTHVLFDLDHTLWDFTANSNATLTELYELYDLRSRNLDLEVLLATYQTVNDQMWYDYNRGKTTKEVIREERFRLTLRQLGDNDDSLADRLNEDYLRICPSKGLLVPYAKEILAYLKERYQLHIVTNGFGETQRIKLETSGLLEFFKEIVHSDVSGFLKPDRRIFDFTLKRIQAECQDCVMIGDDLDIDVLGARNAGIDHVFFNRKDHVHTESLTYEIRCLRELTMIL